MTYVLLYLTEAMTVQLAVAGVVYTVMQLAGAVTRVVLGAVADSYFVTRKFIPLAGMGTLDCLACIPVISLTVMTALPLVAAVMALLGAIALGYNGLYLTMAGELVPTEETGAATAISVAVVILGAVVAPPVFGFLVGTMGTFATALGMLAGCSLFASVLSLSIGPYNPRENLR